MCSLNLGGQLWSTLCPHTDLFLSQLQEGSDSFFPPLFKRGTRRLVAPIPGMRGSRSKCLYSHTLV